MPNTGSINLSVAQGFLSYVQKYGPDLLVPSFTGFEYTESAIGIMGVKGKQILPKMNFRRSSKPYMRAWNPEPDVVKIGYDEIEVSMIEIPLQFTPLDFENNDITGRLRKPGQTQDSDIPYQQKMLNGIFATEKDHLDDASWNAEKVANPTTLMEQFDGQRKIHNTKGNLGQIELVPISGGTYTLGNIIDHFHLMWLTMGKAYRKENVTMRTSEKNYYTYRQAIKVNHPYDAIIERTVNGKKQLRDHHNNYWIECVTNLHNTEFASLASDSRMFYACDAFSDMESFNVVPTILGIDMRIVYKYGVQLTTPVPNAVVYNGK